MHHCFGQCLPQIWGPGAVGWSCLQQLLMIFTHKWVRVISQKLFKLSFSIRGVQAATRGHICNNSSWEKACSTNIIVNVLSINYMGYFRHLYVLASKPTSVFKYPVYITNVKPSFQKYTTVSQKYKPSRIYCTRVSQMKTLNIFLNIIYCAEVVQSCITFQHNLPHAQCKSSSAYKMHKFL